MHRIAALSIVIGLSLAADPAAAQFGGLFGGDSPPRPPGDIPGSQQSPPGNPGQPPPGYQGRYPGQPAQGYPGQYPGQPAAGYPGQYPGQPAPGYQGQYPGRPAQAYPGQPPGYPSRPQSPAVEQQSLPPPPGGAAPGQPIQPADRGYPPPGGASPDQPYPAQPADRGYPPTQPPGQGAQAASPPGRGAMPPPQGSNQGSNQGSTQGSAQAPPTAGPAGADDDTVVEKPTAHITNRRAVFVGLDKITGRTIKFDAAIGETVQFGALQVTPRACYTRPPTEATNTDAFVEVDEVTLKGDLKRIFTGWMFAPSPGLNAIEHPIFDVWLIDCASPVETAEQFAPPAPAAARRPPSPRRGPAPADADDAPQPD